MKFKDVIWEETNQVSNKQHLSLCIFNELRYELSEFSQVEHIKIKYKKLLNSKLINIEYSF